MAAPHPSRVDLQRDSHLTLAWPGGEESRLSVRQLRQSCPCANCRIARDGVDPHRLMRPQTDAERAAADRLAPPATSQKKRSIKLGVLPAGLASEEDVRVDRAELVGNYAIKLFFSDGHASGIYSWVYLRELADAGAARVAKGK